MGINVAVFLHSPLLFVMTAIGSMSFLLGMVDCVAVAIAHFALRANMALQNHIPVFTAPFAITTLMFLATTDTKGNLFRVQNFSYPEKQAAEWWSQRRATKDEDTRDLR